MCFNILISESLFNIRPLRLFHLDLEFGLVLVTESEFPVDTTHTCWLLVIGMSCAVHSRHVNYPRMSICDNCDISMALSCPCLICVVTYVVPTYFTI